MLVAALAGVAAEVELDGGVGGVVELGVSENGFGVGEGFAAACGVGPHDPPAGFGGIAAREFGGDREKEWPLALLLKDEAAQGEDGRRVVGFGQLGELGGGFVDHAEGEVALGVGDAPTVVHGVGGRSLGTQLRELSRWAAETSERRARRRRV